MLKNIPSILSPDLIKVLMEMGHGDEIVIGDGNFPAASMAKKAAAPLIPYDGQNIPELFSAIMQVFPLDHYVDTSAVLMEVAPADRGKVYPKRWQEYREIINQYEVVGLEDFQMLQRFDFYARSEKACAVVRTSDPEIYANIILKKGVITK